MEKTITRAEELQMRSTQLIHNEWARVKSKIIEVLYTASEVVESARKRQRVDDADSTATGSQEFRQLSCYDLSA